MKKSFIALITVILSISMFFSCNTADTLDKTDSSEYIKKTDNTNQNDQNNDKPEIPEVPDEFLSGISYPSIYYDNTLSITPLNERKNVSIQLHTNDIEEARNWSTLSQGCRIPAVHARSSTRRSETPLAAQK